MKKAILCTILIGALLLACVGCLPLPDDLGTGNEGDPDLPLAATPDPELPGTEATVSRFTAIEPIHYYGLNWLKTQPNAQALVSAYTRIAAGIEQRTERIVLKYDTLPINRSEIETVWHCYLADYPQHFWADSQYSYSYLEDVVRSVTPVYVVSEEDLPSYRVRFRQQVETLLAELTPGTSAYETEKAIHDLLIERVTYSDEPALCHSAYAALTEQKAVCDGISKAFQHLCRTAGIQTLFLQGSSTDPATGTAVGHAWNVVELDGRYYHVDVTWDNSGEPTGPMIHYAYFNLTDTQIQEDHTRDDTGYAAPPCTETADQYYEKIGAVVQNLTVDSIVQNSTKTDSGYLCKIFLTDGTDMNQWLNSNTVELMRAYGIKGSISIQATVLGKEIILTIREE